MGLQVGLDKTKVVFRTLAKWAFPYFKFVFSYVYHTRFTILHSLFVSIIQSTGTGTRITAISRDYLK